MGTKVKVFVAQYGIQLVHSSPYYPQANRQAEAKNKLTYGHDAVLPLKITVASLRTLQMNGLSMEENDQALLQELDTLPEERLQELEHTRDQKKKTERAFQKHVRSQAFQEGDMVWKVILPVGPKDPKFGKWSLLWEGPFITPAKTTSGAYRLMEPEGKESNMFINGKYLKRFYPSIWDLE
ncbi:uncharacterized protein LOC127259135 [Andrographis paniculata]|uniref:uncharacterized protein LOC127259135 n=1 Tax=Andrographis paniculata TaxID=175694 RepID=UPI0021E7B066|nr:uncharacterized protein LOC127259135 [Andrographis paniculata]